MSRLSLRFAPSFEIQVPALVLLVLLCSGCPVAERSADDDDSSVADDDDSAPPPSFRFWSPDFEDGGTLPELYECSASNPELRWEGVPAETEVLTLVFDDSSFGDYPHWAVFNIPAAVSGLERGVSGYPGTGNELPEGAQELVNGGGWTGYFGSCPCGANPNTYRWRLWALSEELERPGPGSSSNQFEALVEAAEEVSIEMLEMSHSYGPASICR
tara:strand:- start:4375 stop:5019 length:645 start_codon:yes stop_codon:yes gene_type:complete